MKWNDDRTSVSNQWGSGPTRINLVPAKITFRSQLAQPLRVYALDGTGKRIGEIKALRDGNKTIFEIGDRTLGTLWYELAVD